MNEFDKKASEIEQGLSKLKKEDQIKPQSDKIMGERAFAEIVGGMLFGVFSGYWIDDYFDTSPIFLLVMIILGLAGSIYNIYKATK